MSRRPKHVYEISCIRCPYEGGKCAKKIQHLPVLSDQRLKMWNDADLHIEDCSIYNCILLEEKRH